MGYLIAAQSTSIKIGTAVGAWRIFGRDTNTAPNNFGINAHSWDAGQRMRNVPPGSNRFTRDWSSSGDGVLPMPFQNALFIFPSPLVFSLSLPSVVVRSTVTPSPLVFPVTLPAVDVQRGAVTLTPSPLVFPVALPAVSIKQVVNPSPLVFPLGLPDVSLALSAQTVTPSPLPLPIGLPDVAVFFGGLVTPDPLSLPIVLPAVSVVRGAVTLTPSSLAFPVVLPAVSVMQLVKPSSLIFPLTLPAVDVLRGAVTLTPSPLALPLVLPAVAATNIFYLSPDPLTFPVSLPSVAVELGPVSVNPDPLTLRLFLPRLKRGVGDPTPGRVLIKTLYQVTLTGAADSTTDLSLSAQSVQGTLRISGQDVLSVYVPNGAAVLPAILARLNGTLIVWERHIYSDGTETIGEVIKTPMTEAIRRDRGPVKDTLTLGGRATAEAYSGTTRTLSSVQTMLALSGSHSFRVPYDVDIRPGDTVTYGTYTFRVGAIQINLGITSRELQLQETN